MNDGYSALRLARELAGSAPVTITITWHGIDDGYSYDVSSDRAQVDHAALEQVTQDVASKLRGAEQLTPLTLLK